MAPSIEEMAVFCKKKGFVFGNSEIYNGLAGFWDFGPLGVELKNNVKNAFWKRFVQQRDDVYGIDGSIITHNKVWEASGHVDNFEDAMVECTKCKSKFRADQLIEDKANIPCDGMSTKQMKDIIVNHKIGCPKCKANIEMTKSFNLMFKTNVGPIESEKNIAYLRPETAQVIFTNFRLVADTSRVKLPFGIAQVGKAFRNEISPRDFLFRSREFEQFEIEFFAHPDKIKECPFFKDIKDMKVNVLLSDKKQQRMKIADLTKILKTEWHAYWLAQFYKFFLDYGIKDENLRFREHHKEELAHYASACFDIEYKFPFGWKEIHGNADRGQFDLTQHIKESSKELAIFDEETKKKVVPYVVSEPSQGIERAMLAFLFDAYEDDKNRGNVVLKLDPRLTPVKVAILPLVSNKPELVQLAMKVHNSLKERFNCFFDKSGSIGRRYARQDEVGTPCCVTIDFDSSKNKDVTVRDLITTKQKRIKISELDGFLERILSKRQKII